MQPIYPCHAGWMPSAEDKCDSIRHRHFHGGQIRPPHRERSTHKCKKSFLIAKVDLRGWIKSLLRRVLRDDAMCVPRKVTRHLQIRGTWGWFIGFVPIPSFKLARRVHTHRTVKYTTTSDTPMNNKQGEEIVWSFSELCFTSVLFPASMWVGWLKWDISWPMLFFLLSGSRCVAFETMDFLPASEQCWLETNRSIGLLKNRSFHRMHGVLVQQRAFHTALRPSHTNTHTHTYLKVPASEICAGEWMDSLMYFFRGHTPHMHAIVSELECHHHVFCRRCICSRTIWHIFIIIIVIVTLGNRKRNLSSTKSNQYFNQ